MNAAERKRLTALLQAGDVAAALAFLAPAPRASRPPVACAPLPYRFTSKASRFLPKPSALAVAPCGCTCYAARAIMCEPCYAARDLAACLALIEANRSAIEAAAAHLTPIPWGRRNWRAFIWQASDSDRWSARAAS